ncbi:hypothetical protein PA598K_04782 [Paenibacillus sp. 598K]|nr:hypothetical protein PA598K_04782 [Paenibacillus sp. 598K]
MEAEACVPCASAPVYTTDKPAYNLAMGDPNIVLIDVARSRVFIAYGDLLHSRYVHGLTMGDPRAVPINA